jgi:hypothetical protein
LPALPQAPANQTPPGLLRCGTRWRAEPIQQMCSALQNCHPVLLKCC